MLETIRNLGWGPDVVHAFGWMSGFVPMLLRTEYAGEGLFENAKSIYTPNTVDFEENVDADFASTRGLNDEVVGLTPTDIGASYADIAIYPHTIEPDAGDALQFTESGEGNVGTAQSAYDQLLSEVAA